MYLLYGTAFRTSTATCTTCSAMFGQYLEKLFQLHNNFLKAWPLLGVTLPALFNKRSELLNGNNSSEQNTPGILIQRRIQPSIAIFFDIHLQLMTSSYLPPRRYPACSAVGRLVGYPTRPHHGRPARGPCLRTERCTRRVGRQSSRSCRRRP